MNATVIPTTAVARKGIPMRLLDMLLAPRVAGSRATRWTTAGFFALFTAGALVLGILRPGARGEAAALIIYMFGVGCLWMLWLSGLLLVARDARRLGLPGAVRCNALATCLYAVLTVAAPTVVVAAAGGDMAVAILFPALAVASTLAFVLLPRWIAMWFGFLPAIYIGLHNAALAPSPWDPRFQHAAWVALCVLIVADVTRWRQLLRLEDNDASRWRSTMLLQIRQNLVSRDWGLDRQWDWRRPVGKAIDVDFRDIGPARPQLALRVALGGWFVPQTWRSRLGAAMRVLLPVLLIAPLMLWLNVGHLHSLHKVWRIAGESAGLWVGLFGTTMLWFAIVAMVARRWKEHANLALLALLPGFGAQGARRSLLQAVLRGPLAGFVLLWACVLASVLLVAPRPAPIALASLFVLTMAALTLMGVFKVFAGQPVRTFVKVILGVLLIILTDTSVTLVMVTHGALAGKLAWLAFAGWLALLAWVAWQAQRGWRMLQRRPHPFLGNAP